MAHYYKYPTTVTTYNYHQNQVPFPSVVVCNQNPVHCDNLRVTIDRCDENITHCSDPHDTSLVGDPFFFRGLLKEFYQKSCSSIAGERKKRQVVASRNGVDDNVPQDVAEENEFFTKYLMT